MAVSSNSTALPAGKNMTRRLLLGGLAATPFAAAVPTSARSEPTVAEEAETFLRAVLPLDEHQKRQLLEQARAMSPSTGDEPWNEVDTMGITWEKAGKVTGAGSDHFIDSAARYLQHRLKVAHGGRWDLSFDEGIGVVVLIRRDDSERAA